MGKIAIYFTVIIIILIVLLAIYLIYMYSNNSTTNSLSIYNTQTQTANTIRLGSTSALGSFLTDANGRTLYYFANDVARKSSNCTGQCVAIWPAFYASNIAVPTDFNVTDFGSVQTASGGNQTTYKGWPLYLYSGDKNPGDTNGQGLQNIWFVASNPFYEVMVMNNSTAKTYLADANGKSLYYFKSDVKGSATVDPQSKCTDQCLTTWLIFDEFQTVAPALLKSSDFKEFTRADGQTQLAYKGSPLYFYSGDVQSGDTKGDAFQKLWYLAKP